MEITEVRIKLMDGVQDRLLGFCSITFDHSFVVRDLKIIKGSRGPFVAMPSRKLTDRCRECSHKNPLRSIYCSQCGARLMENRGIKTGHSKAKLYADIAHPIHSECRDQIQQRVLSAYDDELILSQQPGYVCRYDDFGEFELDMAESDRWDEEFARKEQALSPAPDASFSPGVPVRTDQKTSEQLADRARVSPADKLPLASPEAAPRTGKPHQEAFGDGIL